LIFAGSTPTARAIIAAAMCSVEPREPPPHLTLAGSFFICSTTSAIVFSGDAAGSTKTLYSLVRRAIGLAQFVNAAKGDGNAMMVMGAVMLGGIITGKPPVSVTQVTPVARLTTEYNVFVLPANSPFKSLGEVVEQLKKDPGSVKWGGGSRGSTEHIAAAMIAREAGVDASKINYVPFRCGGEATAAILGGNVTVGGSGYSEFQQYIESGRMKPIGVTSEARLKGIAIPTLKEQGVNVVIGNWRGVYGAAGISEAQRKALADMISKATKHKSWTEALEKNNWTPALLVGKEFEEFVDRDFASLRATMVKAGMV
jgi:putative tricarboxylic transport membrane protein